MKKKDSEVQSRRDFFKKATKAALPILGIAVLASNPVVAKAAETAMGCSRYGCGTCSGSCRSTCSGGCSTTCSGSCDGSCKYACQSTCTGGCKNYACKGAARG